MTEISRRGEITSVVIITIVCWIDNVCVEDRSAVVLRDGIRVVVARLVILA